MKPDVTQPFDDTKCFICGRKLPETSDPTNPTFDGYCDQDCIDGKTGIYTVFKLAQLYGFDGEIQDASKYLEKRLFKDTACGVCFAVHKDVGGVTVSGYVEGVDFKCPEHSLRFPFHEDDFEEAITVCEIEARNGANQSQPEMSSQKEKELAMRDTRDNRGTVLIMVLMITMMMASVVYAAVIMGMNSSKALRFYENETICLYAAEAGLARGRHTPESFETEYNGAWLVVNVVEDAGGGVITINSSATVEESNCTLEVVLVSIPITIPQVSSLYLSDYSVINLNGSAFEIEGNNKAGIVTNGSSVEILLMIDAAYYPQITGIGGAPSVGEENGFAFDDVFSALGLISETTLGTELDPHITTISGDAHLTGNQEAYGVLLVNGNLTISGTFDFNGLIMVDGDLTVTGDMLISGSLMVSGDLTKAAGSIAIEYNEDTLGTVQNHIDGLDQLYKQVVWRKI